MHTNKSEPLVLHFNQADALVNVVSASRGLSEGAISKSFLEIGGEALSQVCFLYVKL